MELYKILKEKCCKIGLKAKTREEALKLLAEQACKSKILQGISVDNVYEKLLEREKQGSTGFGEGIAIPHARIEGMKDFLLFIAVFPKGVAFEALDNKKVKIFFVLLAPPEKVNEHLKILAMVSRTLSSGNVKREILKATNKAVLYEAFLRNTRVVDKTSVDARKMKLMLTILYYEDLFYDIMSFFIEEGIEGATILESAGMGQYISYIPLFADFASFMQKSKNSSKTIIALVPEDKIDRLMKGIEEITGDMNKKQGAMVIALDISFFKGSMKMM